MSRKRKAVFLAMVLSCVFFAAGVRAGDMVFLEEAPVVNNQDARECVDVSQSQNADKAEVKNNSEVKVQFTPLNGAQRQQAVSAVQETLISLDNDAVTEYGLNNTSETSEVIITVAGGDSCEEHPWEILN
jgi:hypothetical protein